MSIDKLERTEPYPHSHHATNIERVCMSVCVCFFFALDPFFAFLYLLSFSAFPLARNRTDMVT